VEAGEFLAAGRVEAFAEGETFFEEFEGVESFAEVLFGSGEEIESSAAIGIGGEKLFDDGDLGADFGGVCGLCRSAAHFVLLRLLSESRDGEQSCRKKREDERDKWRHFHRPDFRRGGWALASSRTGDTSFTVPLFSEFMLSTMKSELDQNPRLF
jgi:hypothetical protein